ncbi:MAG: outer membrane beta-barrel protein, partial [Balneolaceae bacterium]
MKKLSIIILTGLIGFLFIGEAKAQLTKAGIGLMYGSEIEQLGLRGDLSYQVNEEFSIVGDLGIYLPDETDLGNGNELTVTWWEANANAHYHFYEDEAEELSAYGLGGLNITSVRVKADGPNVGSETESESEIGLNLGAGAEYQLDFGKLFGELKFVVGSDADQL